MIMGYWLARAIRDLKLFGLVESGLSRLVRHQTGSKY